MQVEGIARSMRQSAYNKAKTVDMFELNEQRYISDGHHRASAARQTHTQVTIKLIDDLKAYKSSYNNAQDLIDESNAVGLDRLDRPRR